MEGYSGGDNDRAYPLLGELTSALVLAVAEEFDNAALIRSEAKKE